MKMALLNKIQFSYAMSEQPPPLFSSHENYLQSILGSVSSARFFF